MIRVLTCIAVLRELLDFGVSQPHAITSQRYLLEPAGFGEELFNLFTLNLNEPSTRRTGIPARMQ